jgi:hypothetical protein
MSASACLPSDPLLDAQIAQATGISHFFLRNKLGQFEQVTDPALIAAALNAGDEDRYYWIFTKDRASRRSRT